jgi:hypothetical protein
VAGERNPMTRRLGLIHPILISLCVIGDYGIQKILNRNGIMDIAHGWIEHV